MTITAPPTSRPLDDTIHRRRWAILGIVCVAVFVTVLDGTIVNIALPTLAVDLDATTRQLQWIVDAYLLVFTGLLLAAGGLGDRYGRKKMLVAGLAVFGLTSAYAGSVGSASELIVGRALMGIGAALIFPATLAIITNVFHDATERAKAIAIWSAVTGVAVAAGPISGGWLLEHFWWGSIFYVNVPVVIAAIVGVAILVPESKEEGAPRLDIGGIVLSIAAITTLVFTIIEAPEWGWLDPTIIAGFALSAVLLVAFVFWELRREHPMLPVSIFRNLRFSAASVSVTSAFFALFGFIFLITQYFQLVKTYTPLEAGVRTLPVAFSIAIASVVAPRIVERIGTSRVVSAGLASMSIAFLWIGLSTDVDTSYLVIAGQMVFLGVGLGLDHGAGDRVDHGLAAEGEGRHRIGGQRHHSRTRRHPRCGDHRQRVQLALHPIARRGRRRLCVAAARAAGVDVGVGRSGGRDRPRARRTGTGIPRAGQRCVPHRDACGVLRVRRRGLRRCGLRQPVHPSEGCGLTVPHPMRNHVCVAIRMTRPIRIATQTG